MLILGLGVTVVSILRSFAFIAASMIATNPDLHEFTPDTVKMFKPVVVQYALDNDLLDNEEENIFYQYGYEDFSLDEVKMFSKGLEELNARKTEVQKYPPVNDVFRFYIDADDQKSKVDFSLRYRNYLLSRQWETANKHKIEEAIRETNHLNQVHYSLATIVSLKQYLIHYGHNKYTLRRLLSELKDTIGEDAYNAAIIPPTVPTHRFEQYD